MAIASAVIVITKEFNIYMDIFGALNKSILPYIKNAITRLNNHITIPNIINIKSICKF